MAANVHIGDVGTLFKPRFVDGNGVVVDISSASVLTIIFNRPNGTGFSRTMTFLTNGVDGRGKYLSVEGDIDVEGQWSMEGYVELPSGHWHSDVQQFPVKSNLPRR